MDFNFTHLRSSFIGALLIALAILAGPAYASEEGEKFNPGELIFHHIADAHDWHFATVGSHHYTVYLPIIAHIEGEGFKVFSSAKLHSHNDETEAEAGMMHGAPIHYAGLYLDEHDHLKHMEGKPVFDLSITKNVASMLISVLLLFAVFFSISGAYKKRNGQAPSGIQSIFEPIIVFIRDEIAIPNIGPKYHRYLPFLLTVFFFIWFNNMLGLIPGGANLTGNIAVTLTLAVIVFVITTFSGNKEYWAHVFNTPGVPWWLKYPVPLMPLVEFIGLFTKPFALMIRLFANITAGHIIILSLLSLIFIFKSFAVGIGAAAFVSVMTVLEFLVAIIQAYVFTLLASMYFGGAVAEHHHEEGHDHENEYEHEFGHDELSKTNIAVH